MTPRNKDLPTYARASAALTQCREILDKFIHSLPADEKETDWFRNWEDQLAVMTKYYISKRYTIMETKEYKEKKKWDNVWKWTKRALYVVAVLGAVLAEHWIGILVIIKSIFVK